MCRQEYTDLSSKNEGTDPALLKLGAVVNAANGLEDLDSTERANIGFMRRILAAKCTPTDSMQKALDYFGADDAEFLLSIAERADSIFADRIFDILIDLNKGTIDITPLDRGIIDAALELDFRGLSSGLFARIRPIFESSLAEGRKALLLKIQGFSLRFDP
jgi:hypothetical protein